MAERNRGHWIADRLSDVSFGWRVLRRSPGFATAAVVTLALGIGANTAMFSVADDLLFRPPPFEHPERLPPRSAWVTNAPPGSLRRTTNSTAANRKTIFER